MNLDDCVLLSRDGVLYRTPFSMLSDAICFSFQKEKLSSAIKEAEMNLDNMSNSYSDTHYSKTDMKNDFCSISSINNLTASAKYTLVSTAQTKINEVLSKNDVDNWYKNQLNSCAEVLQNEYSRIGSIMRQTPPDSSMADYAIAPTITQLIDADDHNPNYS